MSIDEEQPPGALPAIRLEAVGDRTPSQPEGFLRLVRTLFRAHYPDGTVSEPFLYDRVDRRALDATVMAAHFAAEDGVRHVYLRSAVRPPVFMRDPSLVAGASELARDGGLWELPAGLIEPAEQSVSGVVECARRELAEELGFDVPPASLRGLGPSTFPSPGVIGERHFFFEVEVDPRARREPSLDGSSLERCGVVRSVPLPVALAMCEKGQIEDAKTELGLRRLGDRHSG